MQPYSENPAQPLPGVRPPVDPEAEGEVDTSRYNPQKKHSDIYIIFMPTSLI